MSVYIISAVRTPVGKLGGALKGVSPVEMGSLVISEALSRSKLSSKGINMVIMGNVLRTGHGQDISRQCAIRAGMEPETDAYAIDMVCSSGMMSIINAVQMIRTGDAHAVIAGGTESMSQAEFAADLRFGTKVGAEIVLKDTMVVDGLRDPFNMKLMGEEADMVAAEHGARRDELDRISYESHIRAARATDSGYFNKEIVPVNTKAGLFSRDEGIRRDTSLEKLSGLSPAFGKNGVHTAGSSSQISDGAAALVLADEATVKETGARPLAKITGYSWIGVESYKFPEAPLIAVRKLLERTGLKDGDVDYFENNEAFAINSYLFLNEFKIDEERLNPWGGAIALGHPIGASGSRIIVTMLDYLNDLHGKVGVASICHGIGGATAMSFETI